MSPTSLFRRVALYSVFRALLGAHNWAISFAKALVDMGYPSLLDTIVSMEEVDSSLVRHLLAQHLAAIFSPYQRRLTLGYVHPLVS
jgi:hypothetical protein